MPARYAHPIGTDLEFLVDGATSDLLEPLWHLLRVIIFASVLVLESYLRTGLEQG